MQDTDITSRMLKQIVSHSTRLPKVAVLRELSEQDQQALLKQWSSRYPAEIQALRQTLRIQFTSITAETIETIQGVLTAGYQQLLQAMLDEGIRLLGLPPCQYAWVGAGSFSRTEVLPYSDAEYLWLFEDDAHATRWYFWALDQLIVAQIHCVGEPWGLHPDQYMEVDPDERTGVALPMVMQDIIHAINRKMKSPEGVYTEIVSNLQGKLIAGDTALWEQYSQSVARNDLSRVFHKRHVKNNVYAIKIFLFCKRKSSVLCGKKLSKRIKIGDNFWYTIFPFFGI